MEDFAKSSTKDYHDVPFLLRLFWLFLLFSQSNSWLATLPIWYSGPGCLTVREVIWNFLLWDTIVKELPAWKAPVVFFIKPATKSLYYSRIRAKQKTSNAWFQHFLKSCFHYWNTLSMRDKIHDYFRIHPLWETNQPLADQKRDAVHEFSRQRKCSHHGSAYKWQTFCFCSKAQKAMSKMRSWTNRIFT